MSEFKLEIGDDGVGIITWDLPGRSMNVLSWKGFQELNDLFDACFANPDVKGVVLTSGKKDFAGGMDLKILESWSRDKSSGSAEQVFSDMMYVHGILRKIELAGSDPKSGREGKPVAIALTGTTMGIGYEIALSCHRIFCADVPNVGIGLPEIKVGLFPGGGGTTRLARRLGAMAAAPFILRGTTPPPRQALASGLVDEVVPAERLVDCARNWVLEASPEDIVKPWDRKGFRIPGGGPYDKKGFITFTAANAMVNGETQGAYPAARAAIASIYEGFLVSFDSAIRIEARYFAELLLGYPSPSSMIKTLFVSRKQLEKGARRPPAQPPSKTTKLGVLGAGMMGSGIALVAARSGLSVTLLDQTMEAAQRGKSSIASILDKEASRGRLSQQDCDSILAQVTATSDLDLFSNCDLIIEAVFEDPKIKTGVFSRLNDVVNERCIVCSNTSTLPISGLAKSVAAPDRFVGLHFFSPVHRMNLVEIIRGELTSDKAVAVAFDFVRRIRKTPIIVNDAMFFYANRCIIPYVNEGVRMVGEGIRPVLIENSAKQMGMPVGPLQLVDETSLELAAHIAKATRVALGNMYNAASADKVIFALCDQGRFGRKVGAGFYDYDSNGRRTGFWSGLSTIFEPSTEQPSAAEVMNRLLVIQSVEAIRALQENVLEDVREGDVGAVFGWGFAPWSGGPFEWLDNWGLSEAVDLCEQLAAQHGDRFKAPNLLKQYALEGKTFYE